MMNDDGNPMLCSFIDSQKKPHCCYACAWRDEQKIEELTFFGRMVQSIFFYTGKISHSHQIFFKTALFLAWGTCIGSVYKVQGAKLEEDSETYSEIPQWKANISLVVSTVSSIIVILFTAKTINATRNANRFQQDELEYIRNRYCKMSDDVRQRRRDYGIILSQAIQCKTVSHDEVEQNALRDIELVKLQKVLQTNFPLLYKLYPPKIINEYSLVFEIPGQNDKLKPIMLCSHLDVVPAPESDDWSRDPFSGDIINGVIWGRGSIDNKHNVVSQLGAVEEILQLNMKPQRRVVISIGHDEEIGGYEGARNIAKYLQEYHYSFEFILDEGTMMISGAIPGTKENVALIGIAEKGSMNLELSVQGQGGHSSVPSIEEDNVIKVLSQAIVALESKPLSPHFQRGSPFRLSLEYISGKLSFPFNIILSNLWFFGKILETLLVRSSNGVAASMRTTTSVTKFTGGEKINALPTVARAYVNHRVHPFDTHNKVLEYDRKVVNDKRVQMLVMDSFPPSPISHCNSEAFKHISKCVKVVFGFESTPSLMVGNTDTRWYWELSENIFRFSPVPLTMEETKMFHGINEKIRTVDLENMVDFYRTLLLTIDVDRDEFLYS
jgi:carboxypeptidase PM20D1